MKGQLGFFDLDERYAQLSKSGDPLERNRPVNPLCLSALVWR